MALTDAEKAGVVVEVIPDSQFENLDPLTVSDVGVAKEEPVAPTLGGRQINQYDLDLDEYFRVTADELNEQDKPDNLNAVSRKLADDLIARAKQDPQFADVDLNWDALRAEGDDFVIRTFVKNVRPKREGVGDTFALGAESFTRGFAKGAPSFYAGMKTGSAAFSKMPGGPLPKLLAFGTGFLTGSGITALAADAIMEAVAPEQEIAPEDRFVRNMNKAAGEILPGLGLRTMAKEGTEFVSETTMANLAKRSKALKQGKGFVNRMNRILNGSQRVSGNVLGFAQRVNEAYAKAPTKGLARELAAVEAAAFLGAIADSAKPGDPLYRLGGELTGGFGAAFMPSTWIYTTIRDAGKKGYEFARGIGSPTLREQKAVTKILEEAGKEKMDADAISPEDALQFLDDEVERIRQAVSLAEKEGRVVGTLGQLTDVQYLQRLTKKVMQNNAGLSEQARASADAVIEKQIELIEMLFKEGSPDSLKSALLLQEEFYENMLNGLIAQESWKAMERINNVTKPVVEGGVRPIDTGEVISEVLQRVTRLGRQEESALWEAVPQDLDASGSNVVRVFNEIMETEYNPGDTVNKLIRNFPEQLQGEFGTQVTPEISAAQGQLSQLSSSIDKLLTNSPRALPAYEEALKQLKAKDVRTMNYGLEDFDPTKSEAAQVLEYLSKRLARLGTKGVSPSERKELEAAKKLAELRVSKEAATSQLGSLVPEGGNLPNAATTGQLITFRKQMNNIAMNQGERDPQLAGQAAKLARAALDDLAEVGTDDLAYEAARSFSRVFNDRFTRSVVGDIIGFGGKIKVQPERVTPMLIRANDVQSAINIRQVDEALKFLADRDPAYTDLMNTELGTIRQQYDAFMRIMLGGYTDETGQRVGGILNEDGTVNPTKLQNFLNNKALQPALQYLPGLRNDLKDVVSAQRLVDSMVKGQTDETKRLADMQAFVKQFTEYESGPDALDGFIGLPDKRPKTPAANFEKFVQLVVRRNNQNQVLEDNIAEQQLRVNARRAELREARSQDQVSQIRIKNIQDRLTSEEARLDSLLNRRATTLDQPEPVIIDETTPLPIIGAEKPGGVITTADETFTPGNVVEGLKETVFERAFSYASNPSGPKTQFNPFKFESYLFQPLASGKDSVAVILNKNGVLSTAEINHVKDVLETIKKQTAKGVYLGEAPDLVEIQNDSLSALARLIGVKVSDMVAPVSSMGQLQSANIFSNMFHKIMIKMPSHKQELLFTQMSKDPKFFIDMMDTHADLVRPIVQNNLEASQFDQAVEATKDFFARTIGVRLSSAAIRQSVLDAFNQTTGNIVEDAEREAKSAPPPPVETAPLPTSQIPAPALSPQASAPVSAAPPVAAAPAPQTRQKVAQMFPNDPILGANSGIGSLMS